MKKNKLYSYYYQGINEAGKNIQGRIHAPDTISAKLKLRQQGVIVKKIVKEFFQVSLFKTVSATKLIFFIQQLQTLLASGIPIIQALDIISRTLNHKKLLTIIRGIRDHLQAGYSLSESLRNYPQYFNALYCNLIATGEQTGRLDHILNNLVNYQEKIQAVRRKIYKALIYPVIIITVATVVCLILLFLVIPQFEQLFKNFGAELPLFTQSIIGISRFIHHHAKVGCLLSIFIICSWIVTQHYSEKFAKFLEKISLKMPLIGKMRQYAAITRFTSVLGITYLAGIPLIEGLKSSAQTTGNYTFNSALEKICHDINKGHRLYEAISRSNIFPEMVIQMVMIGEESGALAEMLNKIAIFYEQLLDKTVNNITVLIEPILVAILGVIIGGLVVGMYLPIFKLGSII